jgi:four helix bundle protein
MPNIRSYRELDVYQTAIDAAMEIYQMTKNFPPEEKYSMVDQIRRSSRSVCANLGEAWRRRRYPAHFSSKLNDSEAEAEETRVWLEMSLRCGYLTQEKFSSLDDRYDKVIGQLVKMASSTEQWTVR